MGPRAWKENMSEDALRQKLRSQVLTPSSGWVAPAPPSLLVCSGEDSGLPGKLLATLQFGKYLYRCPDTSKKGPALEAGDLAEKHEEITADVLEIRCCPGLTLGSLHNVPAHPAGKHVGFFLAGDMKGALRHCPQRRHLLVTTSVLYCLYGSSQNPPASPWPSGGVTALESTDTQGGGRAQIRFRGKQWARSSVGWEGRLPSTSLTASITV